MYIFILTFIVFLIFALFFQIHIHMWFIINQMNTSSNIYFFNINSSFSGWVEFATTKKTNYLSLQRIKIHVVQQAILKYSEYYMNFITLKKQ